MNINACGSLNRTFMELKRRIVITLKGWPRSLNRTFMELKLRKDTTLERDKEVLIVPLWN